MSGRSISLGTALCRGQTISGPELFLFKNTSHKLKHKEWLACGRARNHTCDVHPQGLYSWWALQHTTAAKKILTYWSKFSWETLWWLKSGAHDIREEAERTVFLMVFLRLSFNIWWGCVESKGARLFLEVSSKRRTVPSDNRGNSQQVIERATPDWVQSNTGMCFPERPWNLALNHLL